MRAIRFVALAAAAALAACGSTVSNAARTQPGQDAGLRPSGSEVGLAAPTVADGTSTSLGLGARASAATATTRRTTRAAGTSAAQTGPITVGIVLSKVSNAAAFGGSLGDTVSERDVDDAIVAAMNERGGIAGRRIVPIYDETDVGSQSWDADFEAVCAKFTQDNKVVAVLGFVFDYAQSFESCLTKKGISHLSTGLNVPDAEELRQAPFLLALSTPRIERRSKLKIDGALATGVLTKASRIGVVIDTCPGTERAWTRTTLPYLQSKGLTVASAFTISCPRGSSDAAAAAAQIGNAILQARSAGVDTVMFPAASEGPILLIMSGAAEAQGWRPKYVLSSLANAAVFENQIPAAQAANVHGYGWLPSQDVRQARWPSVTSSQARCLALTRAKGVTLTSATDYTWAFNICEALFVYERALQATSGRTDGASVAGAIEAIGTSYVSALNLEGRSSFSRTLHDGPALARYFAWDAGCQCFTYRPNALPIG